MKKFMLTATVAAVAAIAITAKTKGPVVMTVDGRDVPLSELEYLYNKNNSQQITPLTFDEYVDMFVNYKLKVADALNAKLDTTAEFRAEFEKFRRDLAEPYLVDKETEEALIKDMYSHTQEDVYVSHIMLSLQDPNAYHKIDSLRQLILDGTITFEQAAKQNSVDGPSAARGGRMAWLTGLSPYPWAFEKASYDTPVGEISEIVNSGVGYHLVRPEERRPARGEVHAAHILVLTRNMDDEAVAQQRARIDSIYQMAIQPGADFAALAREYSEDPGSASNGGDLDWFGSGRMVAEFDSVAFALPVGAISEPFATSYGYHIIHKLGERKPQSLKEMRPTIEKMIKKDNKLSHIAVQAKLDKTAQATNSSKSADLTETITTIIGSNDGAATDEMIEALKQSNAPAYTVNDVTTSIGTALQEAPLRAQVPVYVLVETADRWINNGYNRALTDYIIDQLEATEPAYANLVNEYRDGILLFDISNRNVWERATKDTLGLNEYFQANKEKYSNWTAPHYKAYVIFATNDSILNEAVKCANEVFGNQKISEINQEQFVKVLKDRFNRSVKLERVIASPGENAITDYLAFGGEKPEKITSSWPVYADFAAEIIDQPNEVADCRLAVVTDYQNMLEKNWLDELHKKYKVKINKKALKQANK